MIFLAIKLLFFIPLAVYFAYPLYLSIFARLNLKRETSDSEPKFRLSSDCPSVSMIMAMHNAEHLAAQKIANLSRLEYSGDLKFCFVLDGCSDNTEQSIRKALELHCITNFLIFSIENRIGKEAAIRSFLSSNHSEVLVFSDADAVLDRKAIYHLVSKLAERKVGAVSGREVHLYESENSAGEGEGIFYYYEEFIKKHLEFLNRSLTYVQGGIFAMKAAHYPLEIASGATQDGAIAFECVRNGERVAYCEDAISQEKYDISSTKDFVRRRRTISRAFRAIVGCADILNPLKYPSFLFDLAFGRLLRWFSPYFVVVGSLAALADITESRLSIVIVFLAAIFVVFSLIGWSFEKLGRRVALPYKFFYFTYVHVAAGLAIMDVIQGKKKVTWNPTG